MAAVTLEADRTAVVIVDMQVDFCASEGALYAEGSQVVVGWAWLIGRELSSD